MRQISFLDEELALIDSELSQAALGSQEMRRLMTVPGVNLHTAATFMAAVGNISRFENPRKLVSYLGLDPGCASRAQSPPATGGSRRRAPPRRATCSARPRGW